MVDSAPADPNDSSHNTADSSDPITQDVDNSGTTIDLNGDQPVAPTETQETQDVAMTDQQGTSATVENALPESRIPAKKDATLREFLSKMDDHAPIVSFIPHHLTFLSFSSGEMRAQTSPTNQYLTPDPRRRHKLLLHAGRPPTTARHTSAPGAPPRPRNPKVHCRRGRRRLPVQPYSRIQYVV
jgi:hypothetical protein